MDYKQYISIDEHSLVINAYIAQKNATPLEPTDILYAEDQPNSWDLPFDLLNGFNESKWKYVDGELVEQTEPSIAKQKEDLLKELDAYYEGTKTMTVSIQTMVLPIYFDRGTRSLLSSKYQTLKEAQLTNWVYSTPLGEIPLTIEQVKTIYLEAEQVIDANWRVANKHKIAIQNTNDVMSYDYTKGFITNYTIEL